MTVIADGRGTTLTFASIATPKFYPMSVTPPSVSSDGALEITLLTAAAWRSFVSKSLRLLGDLKITAQWDSDTYADLISYVTTNQLVTVTFPDASTFVFYGFITSGEPGPLVNGELATIEIMIKPTLIHSSTGAVTAPVYT